MADRRDSLTITLEKRNVKRTPNFPHGRSVKWPKVYRGLRRRGMSKEKAARISNAMSNKYRGGRRLPLSAKAGKKGIPEDVLDKRPDLRKHYSPTHETGSDQKAHTPHGGPVGERARGGVETAPSAGGQVETVGAKFHSATDFVEVEGAPEGAQLFDHFMSTYPEFGIIMARKGVGKIRFPENEKSPGGSNVGGFFDPMTGDLVVNTHYKDGEFRGQANIFQTMVHEIGHVIDWQGNRPLLGMANAKWSSQSDFDLWDSDINELADLQEQSLVDWVESLPTASERGRWAYAAKNNREFFAEAFTYRFGRGGESFASTGYPEVDVWVDRIVESQVTEDMFDDF